MPLDPTDYAVKVTSDRMMAHLVINNAEVLAGLSMEDLNDALAYNNISFGIDEEVLKGIVQSAQAKHAYVVAKGEAAKDGVHEQVKYNFNVGKAVSKEGTTEQATEVQEKGSIDFRNIENFNNTKAGTVVAEKSPAQPGSPGTDVYGDEIKARDGKPITLRTGKGVSLSEDGMKAIADVDGHACVIADRVTVMNTVEVPAHVDYSIGNIDFIGNVTVRGGVMPGFTVKAQGDISIADNVEEKVKIICGGSLTIRGIIFGQGTTSISVEGDAEIGAADQAELRVKGMLKVNNYLTHSKVSVGEVLEVVSKRGKIIGGEIRAFHGIMAPFIGNNMATLTTLVVGANPFVSVELDKLKEQQAELENKLEQVRNAIISTMNKRPATGEMPPQMVELLSKLKAAQKTIEPQIEKLKVEVGEVTTRYSDYKEAKIRVSDIMYPGVVINFRDRMQYKTMDEVQRSTFYEEGAEIRTGPY